VRDREWKAHHHERQLNDFVAPELWRVVVVQQTLAEAAAEAIAHPAKQDPVSFNLDATKTKIRAAIKAHEGL
jgi:hypothetical protein